MKKTKEAKAEAKRQAQEAKAQAQEARRQAQEAKRQEIHDHGQAIVAESMRAIKAQEDEENRKAYRQLFALFGMKV